MAKNVKKFREKEVYKDKIVEMVDKIDNIIDLQMIYGMVKSAYKQAENKKADGI